MEESKEQSQQPSSQESQNTLVLVTGASGYLAGHVVNTLLEKGYKVRGTVRSLKDSKKNDHIMKINPDKSQNLELVEADLLDEKCWDTVVPGCQYIMHVASPFPPTVTRNEDDVIKPAVMGTTAIMQAALKHNVKKIVITSSMAAVYSGHNDKNHFTAEDWSNLQNVPPYEKSKHLAEKAAWQIYNDNKGKIKLTVINPGFIQGPCFHANAFTSGDFVIRVLNNDLVGIPQVTFPFVDVRDVALAHVLAIDPLKEDITDGKRYVLIEGSYWLGDAISILRDEFTKFGYKVPCMNVGKTIFTIASWFDSQAALLKPYYGRMITFDNTPSRTELGIIYLNNRKTVLDTAYCLIEKGVIKDKINKKSKK